MSRFKIFIAVWFWLIAGGLGYIVGYQLNLRDLLKTQEDIIKVQGETIKILEKQILDLQLRQAKMLRQQDLITAAARAGWRKADRMIREGIFQRVRKAEEEAAY